MEEDPNKKDEEEAQPYREKNIKRHQVRPPDLGNFKKEPSNNLTKPLLNL